MKTKQLVLIAGGLISFLLLIIFIQVTLLPHYKEVQEKKKMQTFFGTSESHEQSNPADFFADDSKSTK